ncbi:F-box domain-containing protein [Pacmanvirus A23]|uniref:F-box domain-containing protein n=1 Tax=Pacmanvirus A23 TaxID=1932881 RepID=UPI000A09347C|nr:F-box domain-containing protein [Pacmanvirus A23]SIP85903.1 F-box domain-containing protein [Pacmanvirus A23]
MLINKMNLQELPPEIILSIYLFLGRKDKATLLQTSRLLLDCCPTKEYIRRIKFKQCMKKIRLIEYSNITMEIHLLGENIGSSISYYLNSTLNKEPTMLQSSFRWFGNYGTMITYYSHKCLRPNDIVIADEVIVQTFAEKKNGKVVKIIKEPIVSRHYYNRMEIKLT